jgi:ATP-dependent helicase/nuclease subunit B
MDIYLGKSKSGKSKLIYENIDKDIKSGKNVILFVPSQSRVLAEKEYMEYLKKDGIIGVNITTIGIYIQENIKKFNLHLDKKYISKLDRKIILTQIISKNSELFKVFKKVKKKQGFLDMLSIYIDILKKNKYSANDFKNLNLSNKLTENKLNEIVSVYDKYIEKINMDFVDSIDEMDIFISNLMESEFYLENTKIYFDGYNNFTKSEYEYINMLLKKNIDVTFAITTDITSIEDIYADETSEIFKTSNQTYKMLLKFANSAKTKVHTKVLYENHSNASESLVRLANNIFSDNVALSEETKKEAKKVEDDIHIILETNKYSEIQNIAKHINSKIKEGYRYKDFCIYTTNIEEYENIVSKIFYEYNISLYIDSSKSIEITKLTSYIMLLLEIIVQGVKTDSIIDILKLGLNEFNEKEIYELENYILEFNINKYNFLKEFTLNNKSINDTVYDLEKLNITRIKIQEFLNKLLNNLKGKITSKEIVKTIYEHLISDNIIKNYIEMSNKKNVGFNAQESIYDINFKNLESQVWGKICEVFDSICKIYGDEKISIKEFYEVFKISIKDIKLKSIPPTNDQVSLIDINVSRAAITKQVFFIGVNENSFPKKVEQDVFFSDDELKKLDDKGLKLKETSLDKLNMQLFNIYNALNNVSEKLYIYIPSAKSNGAALRKSSLVTLIQKVTGVGIVGDVVKEEEDSFSKLFDICDIDNSVSEEELFETMLKSIKQISNKGLELDEKNSLKLYSLYSYFKEKPTYNDILNYEKNDDNLDSDTIKSIYADVLKTSVSKLETFEKCPFSYFVKYILNINKEKRYKITNMDIGSFMHNVLEKFSMYLFENKKQWQEIILDENKLDQEYEEILYKIIENELEFSLKKHKESVKYYVLKQKLVTTMKKVVIVIARGFNQSEFVPYGYEIEFKEGAAFSPIKIQLENSDMYLVGKIDRIDVLNQDDKMYVRVVDYKSSSKTLNLDDIRQGLSLQLITYISAFIDNMKKINDEETQEKSDEINNVIPSAMLYFTLSDKIVNLKEYTNDSDKIEEEIIKKLRMKGIFLKDAKIIEKMDNKLNDKAKKLIDISKTSLKEDSKSNKALDQKEFEKLCDDIKIILKNIGEKVISGVVKIQPNKKASSCDYCEYSSVCRKNICL